MNSTTKANLSFCSLPLELVVKIGNISQNIDSLCKVNSALEFVFKHRLFCRMSNVHVQKCVSGWVVDGDHGLFNNQYIVIRPVDWDLFSLSFFFLVSIDRKFLLHSIDVVHKTTTLGRFSYFESPSGSIILNGKLCLDSFFSSYKYKEKQQVLRALEKILCCKMMN